MRILTRTLCAALALALVSPLRAADPPPPPNFPAAPPPPGIDNPTAAQSPATPPPDSEAGRAAPASPYAPLPKPDSRISRDKASRAAEDSDDVRVRQQGGDTVEEYRRGGHVWMIRIHPAGGGPVQTFMDTDGSGRLARDPREGPVAPVYYTIYEWK